MSGRDYQKSKVYKWENEIIGPKGGTNIQFADAQMFVDAVWLSPDRPTRTWIILHELAHSMTGDTMGTDHHREDFLGVYMKLIDRHLKIPLPLLMFTANKAGLKFNLAAQPRCLDENGDPGP